MKIELSEKTRILTYKEICENYKYKGRTFTREEGTRAWIAVQGPAEGPHCFLVDLEEGIIHSHNPNTHNKQIGWREILLKVVPA